MNRTSRSGNREIVAITTAPLKGRAKFDFWHDVARRSLAGADVSASASEPFDVCANGIVQDGLSLTWLRSQPCKVVREPDRGLDPGADFILLFFVLAGPMLVEQDGREVVVNPGDGTTLVADRRYMLRIEDKHEAVCIRLPRLFFPQGFEFAKVTARPFSDAKGMSGLLSNFARGLCRNPAELDAPVVNRLARSFADLLDISYRMMMGDDGLKQTPHRTNTLNRVKSFIELHLSDVELTTDRVAEHMRLSPRYLNKLFACEDTSLSRYIWDRRLQRAASDLARVAPDGVPVKAIASAHGFRNLSHFSTAFRERFQVSPREYRYQAMSFDGANAPVADKARALSPLSNS